MSDKIMAFGRELLVTPDTLGVHTSESEDKLLDIPLVADKIGKYDEDDIDEISENLTKCELKKLWENPSPSSAFEPQTISINLSDYDYIKIICMWDYANKNCGSLDILKNEEGTISIVTSFSSGIYCVSRNVTPTDNGIEITQGVRGNATSNSVSNTYCVPISIYGGKFA